MDDPRPPREEQALLGVPMVIEPAAPTSPDAYLPAVAGLRYAIVHLGAQRCTVPRCGATLSGNPDAGGPRCCACMQPYPRAWRGPCIYCGTRVMQRGMLKQLDVPAVL